MCLCAGGGHECRPRQDAIWLPWQPRALDNNMLLQRGTIRIFMHSMAKLFEEYYLQLAQCISLWKQIYRKLISYVIRGVMCGVVLVGAGRKNPLLA